MTFEKPVWMTKEFIQNAIEDGKELKERVTVESLEIDMPVPKGNNYASDIFGVRATYRITNDLNNLHQICFIIKGQISGPMGDLVMKYGLADNETLVYNGFAPKLKSLFDEKDTSSIDYDDFILPKAYYSSEDNVIILEDLKHKGYKMVDKTKQLDYDHCILALKSLAKFHAGSVVIHEKEPESVSTISQEEMYMECIEQIFAGLTKSSFLVFANECKLWPNLEKYSKWFFENSEKVLDFVLDNLKHKELDFNVLIHGDFCVTNMLFKYVNNRPLKVKLIDLQGCRYASPVLDFIEFFETSVQESVRTEKTDELISVYLEELNSLLERYESPKRLDKLEFKRSLNERFYYRVFMSTFALSLTLADPKEVPVLEGKDFSAETFNDLENSPSRAYMKNERFINIITKRLIEFEKSGFITIVE